MSSGEIVTGQGQDSITVDVSAAKEQQVTAEVEVKGLPADCQTRASYTTVVGVAPYKLSEFEENHPEALEANLDNLTVILQREPSLEGYLIVYGGRSGKREHAAQRTARAKYYLTEMRGLAPDRFAIMEGGYRENPMFEVWLVLGKGARPSPTPSVDPRYVEFEGNSRKRRR
jgi:hypothetical protein